MKGKNMTDKDCRYIENNLQLTNRELASKIGVSIYQVKHYLEQKNLRRTSEQLKQIFLQHGEDQRGARNPNWKGGRSKNHYFYKLRAIAKDRAETGGLKIQARNKVQYHKKVGNITLEPCAICGSKKNIEAHHLDLSYNDALDVQPLCRQHHRALHKEINNQKNQTQE